MQGHFYFDSGLSTQLNLILVIVFAIVATAFSLYLYRNTTRPLAKPWKISLTTLRAVTFFLLLLCLLNPSVEQSEVIPQETYLAVLVDDSQSMTIADGDEKTKSTRHQQIDQLLYGENSILDQLAEKFQVRTYRFSELAQRVTDREDFTQNGGKTRLQSGIEHAMSELSSFPMSGVVLLTDGAHNSTKKNSSNDLDDPLIAIEKLVNKEVPLFAVGVGKENIDQDVSIASVNVAKSLLEGSIYTVDVTVEQSGYDDRRVELFLAEKETTFESESTAETSNQTIVDSRSIQLSSNGTQRHTLDIRPKEKDVLVYTLTVEEQIDETVTQNNHYTFFVDNREKKALDILYVEGQPRNEYKFIRRAVKDDESLRLATYLQTGPRKYLRQGIKSPEELSSGFPLTEDTLYEYEAIIFGNVERSFFNDQQLELVKTFVAKRGGGFMLVGGLQESFIDSPIADILPVQLVRESQLPLFLQGGPRRGEHLTGQTFVPRITKAGERSPLLRLSSDDRKNRSDWKAMPELEGVYVSGRAKSGASVLIEHPSLDYQSAALPILTAQRYGAGRSLAFSTASSWRWQMLLPHEDQSHEKIWRQMLRWLSTESEKRLSIAFDEENYSVDDRVKISATLFDDRYEPDNNGVLWVAIKDPNANVTEIPMKWDLEKEGTYNAEFTVKEEGVYDIQINVPSETDEEVTAKAPLIVTSSRREFLNAEMNAELLGKMAELTGGGFYTAGQANQLVDDIIFNPTPYSKKETKSIWDQPLFFYLLVLLLGLEWLGRRYKGLS